MGYLLTALGLMLVILVHEFGHFWMLRRSGIQIQEFSIGFLRPIIFSWKDKSGTQYNLRPLFLGGYIKHDDKQYIKSGLWVKIKILLAGVFLNTILAFVLFMIYFAFSGAPFIKNIISSFGLSFGFVLTLPYLLVKYFYLIAGSKEALVGPVGLVYLGNGAFQASRWLGFVQFMA